MEQVFGGFDLIEPGLKHKTVTVVINHKPLEITAYRTDGDYSDRRHPGPVSFTGNLKDDLKRRNFTMNGLIMLAGIGSRLVWFHDIPITADRKPVKRLLSKYGDETALQLIELHQADTMGQSDLCKRRIAIFEEVSQIINEILQE